MNKLVLWILSIISAILFLVSLALPAFETSVTYLIESRMYEPSRAYMGYQVFFLGWASAFFGVFAWFANIGYLVTFALIFNGNKFRFPVSIVTVIIALSSLTYPTIEKSENGYDFYISEFNLGFYCWITAISILCVTALLKRNQRQNIDGN